MLVRDTRRLVLLAVLVLVLVYSVVRYRSHGPIVVDNTVGWVGEKLPTSPDRPKAQKVPDVQVVPEAPAPPSPPEPPSAPKAAPAPEAQPPQVFPTPPSAEAEAGDTIAAALAALPPVDPGATHHELFSASTASREYFELRFGDQKTMNPNIIPHPTRADTWIMVAQKYKTADEKPQWWFSELVCAAAFSASDDGGVALACREPPTTLPVAATGAGRCSGALDFFSLNVGPHDARVFYGPEAPYALYGSNSAHTCFGQWLQDFRALFPWDREVPPPAAPFRVAAELHRPPPWAHPVEKNWFLFWDAAGRAYVHHDLAPRRVFAAVRADGTVGPDLASSTDSPAAARDAACLARRLPALAPADESLHQATNSLAVTLCRRADAGCARRPGNTVLLSLFHHKSFHRMQGQYEPYAVVFDDAAPFALRGFSAKPLWLAGRRRRGDDDDPEQRPPTDMLFVTSIAWRDPAQTYHGFLDDVLFVAFGVDDERSAAIDVRAEDLLRGIALCEDEA